ncbi:MAG: DUF2911 domain-containing protein [Acidobacteriota bacterium]|nr:DUF2911 domain-containing protein [Acidobacteriota bacterium]
MTRRTVFKFSAAALPFAQYALAFQNKAERVSPHETVSADLGGDKVEITYGRPYLKARTVGKEVAPFGKVWRLGADEASKITVSAEMQFGELKLAAGSYSLFAIPGTDKWTLIVDKVADQWGAFKYEQSQDLGRFDVPVQKLSTPVEEFTISVGQQSGKTAKLTFAWGNESVSTTLKSL